MVICPAGRSRYGACAEWLRRGKSLCGRRLSASQRCAHARWHARCSMGGATQFFPPNQHGSPLMKTGILIFAVLAALGIAASASAATQSESAAFATQSQALSSVRLLARHGADDPVGGEDAGCDD